MTHLPTPPVSHRPAPGSPRLIWDGLDTLAPRPRRLAPLKLATGILARFGARLFLTFGGCRNSNPSPPPFVSCSLDVGGGCPIWFRKEGFKSPNHKSRGSGKESGVGSWELLCFCSRPQIPSIQEPSGEFGAGAQSPAAPRRGGGGGFRLHEPPQEKGDGVPFWSRLEGCCWIVFFGGISVKIFCCFFFF